MRQRANASTIQNAARASKVQARKIVVHEKINIENNKPLYDSCNNELQGTFQMQVANETGKSYVPNFRVGLLEYFFRFYSLFFKSVDIKCSRTLKIIRDLQLNEFRVCELKKSFHEIDVDRSGEISSAEFLASLNIGRSPFTDELFRMMDVDHNERVDFEEFVYIVCMFCIFRKRDIERFVFDTYDRDKSSFLTSDEVNVICRDKGDTNKAEADERGGIIPGNYRKLLLKFDDNQDGVIDMKEFKDMERKYPMVLFQAFEIQTAMRKMTFGIRTWESVIDSLEKRKVWISPEDNNRRSRNNNKNNNNNS